MKPNTYRALVLTGDGLNCERETAQAFELAGFQTTIAHLNDLIRSAYTTDALSSEYSVLAIPGGFSFGDDLGSGKVLALKLQFGLKWDLAKYCERGGMVLGVCNGFQALIKMGVFGRGISITSNLKGKFSNTWVKVSPVGKKCVWTRRIGSLDLPIRHGEGRIIIDAVKKKEILVKFERQEMACLKYEMNPNGSFENIAGICDPTGRIFGLMPHPESFVRWSAHPDWTSNPEESSSSGDALKIFENAFQEASGGGV